MTVAMMPARRVTQAALCSARTLRCCAARSSRCYGRQYSASMEVGDDRGWGCTGPGSTDSRCRCTASTTPPLFLPWHRAYLYFFELSLKRFAPTVTLPWWDWTSTTSHRRGLPSAYVTAQVGGAAIP